MDGEFVPWADAKVHVLTHALHYGSAVFEGERAYGGEIFELTRTASACTIRPRILGFEIPYSVETINQACNELLVRHGLADAYVRPIAYRGSEMMGVSAQQTKIHSRHRGVGVAVLLQAGRAAEGHPPRHGAAIAGPTRRPSRRRRRRPAST